MIEASGIRLPLDAGLPDGEALVRGCVANALGVDAAAVVEHRLLKRSVDARKGEASFIATFAVSLAPAELEEKLLAESAASRQGGAPVPARKRGKGKRARRAQGGNDSGDEGLGRESRLAKNVRVKSYKPYEPLDIAKVELRAEADRPLVVGTGPAGLFAALYLARAGLRPVVVERGGAVEERMRAVEAFNAGGTLDLTTNIQFGEGGAGTFSDGKLTTGTKNPFARHVLQWFVDAGAPDDILWEAKPHIGTDKLVDVVRTLRAQIEQAGGEVLFHTKLDGLGFDDAGRLSFATLVSTGTDDGPRAWDVPCSRLVLACGHSARDTFRMLQRAELAMEPKAFSVGVRIEHLQKDIDRAQYGKASSHPALGPADYKLVVHLPSGRSVYTFCMCPGGEVVAAASEEYGVVVNGMSRYARDGVNANAALLVGVNPDDFKSRDPLAGTVFQRRIEQAAFGEAHELCGEAWQAPAQTVGDFLAQTAGNPSQKVKPSYARGVVWCDLRDILPEFVTDALAEALPLLDRKLRGFADEQAVMTGVETRSSSPVRILRDDDTLQSWRQPPRKRVRQRDIDRGHGRPPEPDAPHTPTGIYPCGEGPGYAGGIMSSAVDGLRVAQALAAAYAAEAGAKDA